ncbi:MAG: RNA ligase family protein [Patescibacteria group bacterium]|jgi:hypothetical protein
MLRKLVSIQRIDKLESIEGRDRILKATVLGWNLCVKKGEFKEGDKCIFFECDCVLPDGPGWSEFMRSRKFRVCTIRFAGHIFQGLALPCSVLPGSEEFDFDTEITEQLNVKKYEPQLHNGGAKMGQSSGAFPCFIPKTDEIRLQSKPRLLDELRSAGSYYVSIKVDGTSSTFCYDNEFCACSRNWKKRDNETNIYWKMARKYNLQEVLKDKMVAIQGEIAGPGIQQNRLRLLELDLFVFDIFDIKKGRYFGLNDMLDFCEANKLRTVPIESIIVGNEISPLSTWIKRAEGIYEGTDQQREGIVIRPLVPTYSSTLCGRLSFKVINNLYLLSGRE